MTSKKELTRFWFSITTLDQWYGVMRECRNWFGKDWQGMSKVRRKFTRQYVRGGKLPPVLVWFDVPDPRFATWISVKMSIQVHSDAKLKAAK